MLAYLEEVVLGVGGRLRRVRVVLLAHGLAQDEHQLVDRRLVRVRIRVTVRVRVRVRVGLSSRMAPRSRRAA